MTIECPGLFVLLGPSVMTLCSVTKASVGGDWCVTVTTFLWLGQTDGSLVQASPNAGAAL